MSSSLSSLHEWQKNVTNQFGKRGVHTEICIKTFVLAMLPSEDC
jgi:hypothetical protein